MSILHQILHSWTHFKDKICGNSILFLFNKELTTEENILNKCLVG